MYSSLFPDLQKMALCCSHGLVTANFKTRNGESGNGERGTGNGERGTGNGEQGVFKTGNL